MKSFLACALFVFIFACNDPSADIKSGQQIPSDTSIKNKTGDTLYDIATGRASDLLLNETRIMTESFIFQIPPVIIFRGLNVRDFVYGVRRVRHLLPAE